MVRSEKGKNGILTAAHKLKERKWEVAKSTERASVLADYFETKQWGFGTHEDKDLTQEVLNEERGMIFAQKSNIKESNFTMDELDIVLKKAKTNKETGPDGLPLEFFKWLSNDAKEIVLEILNNCWEAEILPTSLELAEVVTLYKKGNVEDPGNYRPISLLQSLYKLYAS